MIRVSHPYCSNEVGKYISRIRSVVKAIVLNRLETALVVADNQQKLSQLSPATCILSAPLDIEATPFIMQHAIPLSSALIQIITTLTVSARVPMMWKIKVLYVFPQLM